MQLAGELFQPRGEIDRGADAGEIEPVAAADIAVEHLSDMQSEAEAETVDGVADRIPHRLDAGAGLARGLQHARANRCASPTYSSIGNTASNPSPMNFSTSPP